MAINGVHHMLERKYAVDRTIFVMTVIAALITRCKEDACFS